MKLNPLLSIYAVITTFFGIALVIMTEGLVNLYGPVPVLNAPGIHGFRVVGALFIGLAVLAWSARGAEAGKARDSIVLALTVINVLTGALAVYAGATGTFNSMV